jgi:hypothetical protein
VLLASRTRSGRVVKTKGANSMVFDVVMTTDTLYNINNGNSMALQRELIFCDQDSIHADRRSGLVAHRKKEEIGIQLQRPKLTHYFSADWQNHFSNK